MRDTATATNNRIGTEIQNINDAEEQELGYVKSILAAIELMARTDSHRHKLEIVNLAQCAHWIADNLESNIDYMGDRVVEISGELH